MTRARKQAEAENVASLMLDQDALAFADVGIELRVIGELQHAAGREWVDHFGFADSNFSIARVAHGTQQRRARVIELSTGRNASAPLAIDVEHSQHVARFLMLTSDHGEPSARNAIGRFVPSRSISPVTTTR